MSHGGQSVRFPFAWAGLLAALIVGPLAVAHAADSDDRRAVASLDTQYPATRQSSLQSCGPRAWRMG
jgi:hypothetical protein